MTDQSGERGQLRSRIATAIRAAEPGWCCDECRDAVPLAGYYEQADAVLADLGLRYLGMLYEDHGEFHQYDTECCPAQPDSDLPACIPVYAFGRIVP